MRPTGIDPARLLLIGPLAESVAASLTWPVGEVRASVDPSLEDLTWATSVSGFVPPAPGIPEHITWVHSMGAGVDRWWDAGTNAHLTRTVGGMPHRAARFAVTAVLNHQLAWMDHYRNQIDRTWIQTSGCLRPVLVMGAGMIGGAVVRAFEALGYEVHTFSRSGRTVADSVRSFVSGSSDLPLCDYGAVIITLPRTPATEGLVDRAFLQGLRCAVLVNLGRSAVLDHTALRDALNAGQVSHAVLDVHNVEPLPDSAWQWSHPNVLVTPHCAALTAPDDVVSALTAVRVALTRGEPIPLTVNPEEQY